MSDPNETNVVFSVKELFLDLKNDLKRIEGKLEHKADQAEVAMIEKRVTTLETDKASSDAVERYKRWQVIVAGIASLGLIAQAARQLGLLQ